jgi:hypothetical protein
MPLVDITTQDEQVIKQLFDLAVAGAPTGSRLQVSAAALAILQKIEQGKKVDGLRPVPAGKKEAV